LLSLLFYGRVELARVGGHARAPAKPRKLGYMTAIELATCGVPVDPTSPASVGGIRHVVRAVLRGRIWCAFTLIPPLAAVVIRLEATSLTPFGDPAYSSLCDHV
jgi:hypothetical protein